MGKKTSLRKHVHKVTASLLPDEVVICQDSFSLCQKDKDNRDTTKCFDNPLRVFFISEY